MLLVKVPQERNDFPVVGLEVDVVLAGDLGGRLRGPFPRVFQKSFVIAFRLTHGCSPADDPIRRGRQGDHAIVVNGIYRGVDGDTPGIEVRGEGHDPAAR